jgi:peptide chain release factor subunit 1
MLIKADIDALGAFRSERFLATSLYLPLDFNTPPKFPVLIRDLTRQAAENVARRGLSHEGLMSARRDLEQLERYAGPDLDRGGALGLAAFSSAGEDFWRSWLLPVSVPARLAQGRAFDLRPLAGLLDEYRRIMFVLIDRRKARIFGIQMAQVVERSDILDDVPGRVREGGFMGYEEPAIRGHIEDHVHRHFEHVARRAFESFMEHGFDWLAVGGQETETPQFIATLHPYLRERLRGLVEVALYAPDSDIRQVGLDLERRIKAERDAELISHVREGLFPGGWAVSGLSDTLQLLAQGQVRTLLVRPGFRREGVWCPRCNLLLPDRPDCPRGCPEAVAVSDVIDTAVGMAFDQGTEVAHVEDAAMESFGNAAAVLRYSAKRLV